jgi:hypothetical protein
MGIVRGYLKFKVLKGIFYFVRNLLVRKFAHKKEVTYRQA